MAATVRLWWTMSVLAGRFGTRSRSIFADIQKFSQQLASINLVEPINEINQFAATLNTIPLGELAGDVQQITQQLAALNFTAIESDLRQFTAMLAAVEIQPLIDEIMPVTEQIKGLNLDQRGAEIAQFTALLAEIPLKSTQTCSCHNNLSHSFGELT